MAEPIGSAGRVAVVGAGAWGQALANHCAGRGLGVTLWARDPSRVLGADGRSRRLGIAPHPAVSPTGSLAIGDADCALLAVPVQHLRAIAGALRGAVPLVACCKGIEASSLMLPLEILDAIRPGAPAATLTGPNFAREVAAGLPASSVVASRAPGLARALADRLGDARLRLYPSDDPVGAELGGAAKNVVAIAAGAAIGAGYGENARAALITRGLAEIARLATALGGRAETVSGLSGAGDLILTCTGDSSRNFRLGEAFGRAARAGGVGTLAARAILDGDEVAEGAATAPALVARAARAGVEMPIAVAVASMLSGAIDAHAAARLLLARPINRE